MKSFSRFVMSVGFRDKQELIPQRSTVYNAHLVGDNSLICIKRGRLLDSGISQLLITNAVLWSYKWNPTKGNPRQIKESSE